MKFDGGIEDLDGAGIEDEEKLNLLFTTLEFDVKVHRNLKAKEMKLTVESYSRDDHKKRAFILILLSHGGEGDVVYGTDGEEVGVHTLQEMFHTTKCPSLAGVPKVFLIDACRGSKQEEIYRKQTKLKKTVKFNSSTISSTASSDFTIVFASTRGNVALSNDKQGSYFTQTFVKVVTEADVKKEFSDITRETSNRIQKLEIGQTVESQTTFTKEYYIKRFVY